MPSIPELARGRGSLPEDPRAGAAETTEAPARARWRLSNLSRTKQRIVVWGGIIVAWQIFGMIAGPFFFASFTATVQGFYEIVAEGHLGPLGLSLRQLLIGYGLAVVVGVPAGIFIGASWIGEASIALYVRALFVTSLEAMLPFLIILVGSDLQLRVAVVFLFAVLYITINTTAGVRDVDVRYLETARAFGASWFAVARKVIVYSALPYIFAGLRIGWGFAVKGMVIAELWVVTGIGRVLVDLGGTRQLDKYFALALLIVSIGGLGGWVLRRIQRFIAPWSEVSGGAGLRRS